MTIVCLGIYFLIVSILHGVGCPYVISKKYRSLEFIKKFQKGLVFPYAFLGVGWIILGLKFLTFEEQNSTLFCVYLIGIAILPFILLMRQKKKLHSLMNGFVE